VGGQPPPSSVFNSVPSSRRPLLSCCHHHQSTNRGCVASPFSVSAMQRMWRAIQFKCYFGLDNVVSLGFMMLTLVRHPPLSNLLLPPPPESLTNITRKSSRQMIAPPLISAPL
jgi:hypothetical protein